jgi:hypothetical protein
MLPARARLRVITELAPLDGFRWLDRTAARSAILVRRMSLLDPRLLEIEILSEAERKTFAGGTPYEHRRGDSVDREREEALIELVVSKAIVFAKSYTNNWTGNDGVLEEAAAMAVEHLLSSRTIIPLKITQRGRLRLARLRDEILAGRDRIKDDFGKAHRHLRGELVFCDAGGRVLTKEECKWPLWRACKKAGLRLLGWHALRHTFAPHLVMRSAPIKAVQELMGHATIEMTMRYSHLSPDVRKDAVSLLDRAPVGAQGGHKIENDRVTRRDDCGGAGSRTLVKGPNRNERRRGLTHQTHEIVWTSRSRSIPRRPT